MQYMAIVRNDGEAIHEMLRHLRLNYMGQELLFASDDSSVCSDEYLARLRRDGIFSWVNTPVTYLMIVYSVVKEHREVFCLSTSSC